MDDSHLPAISGGPAVRPEGAPDWPLPDSAVAQRITQALADGSWGRYHGPHLPQLAARLCADHGLDHAILCASGTAAVELSLRGLHVGPGDEVIVAAYDFKGNFQNVLTLGALPVLVDVRADNCTLDATRLEAAIGPATRAIIATHLHGGIVDMPQVLRIAGEHGIAVVEDAAQMPLARVFGRPAGTWGDAGILSFGGSKLVTSGRGGALLTRRADIAQRVRLYTQRGNEAYPLSEMQAAAILPQWESLAEYNARRAQAVAWITQRLPAGVAPFLNPASDSSPGFYKFGLKYEPAAFAGLTRERFVAALRAEGIAMDAGFRALHLTHAAKRFRAAGSLDEATRADASLLVLHHPVLLGSPADWGQIIEAIAKVQKHAESLL
jgi:perosamine synthetase